MEMMVRPGAAEPDQLKYQWKPNISDVSTQLPHKSWERDPFQSRDKSSPGSVLGWRCSIPWPAGKTGELSVTCHSAPR